MRKSVKDAERTAAAKKTVKAAAEKVGNTMKEAAVKAEAVEEAAKKTAEAVKEEAKKTAEAVKEEAKKTTEKTAARKCAVKEAVYLQYLGKEIDKDDLMKQVKEIWTKELGQKVSAMKSVTLYLKPEENKAYYVINGDVTGSIDL